MLETMPSATHCQTRRERQKLETREAILNAALGIARTKGWAAVTVRQVADLIEYRAPIIYQYFENKDALLEELEARGFALLVARLQGSGTGVENARERILKMSDAYVGFAYEQPELYQLMHGWGSANTGLDKTLAGGTSVAEIVQECFVTWATEQRIVFPDLAANIEIAWALLHGLISVEMLGRINGGRQRVTQLARRAMADLLDAWAT